MKAKGGCLMKKFLVLLLSAMTFIPATVDAQENNAIQDLQVEIKEIGSQLESKRDELNQLIEETKDYYLIESNTATYIFSNPRIYEDKLLLDLDVTNDTKGRLDINNDIWSLSFSQEDDASVTSLWINTEKIPDITDRKQLSNGILVKKRASMQLVIALSPDTISYPEERITETDVKDKAPFSNLSPLHVRLDSYQSPTGMTKEIIINLEGISQE